MSSAPWSHLLNTSLIRSRTKKPGYWQKPSTRPSANIWRTRKDLPARSMSLIPDQKIKKGPDELVLSLRRNPDILRELGRRKKKQVLVGFAAETEALAENEDKINKEMLAAQGSPVDIGGYYQPELEKVTAAMRPSSTFNTIIDGI